MTKAFWFRKDLRINDNPALVNVFESGERVFAVTTADTLGTAFSELGVRRKNSLRASWASLNLSLENRLTYLQLPSEVAAFAVEHGVSEVHVSKAFDTNGVRELRAVRKDLEQVGVALVEGPGNYAVAPGSVTKNDGSAYRVYTPFFNEWLKHGWGSPVLRADLTNLSAAMPQANTFDPNLTSANDVRAGEDFAMQTLQRFLESRVAEYQENRNRPDIGGTSHLSHALSHGEIHPRTILAQIPEGPGADVFRKEIAWREFNADVLWQRPDSLYGYLDPKYANMRYDFDEATFQAWKDGVTGFPMVDAGMRQLRQTGWMHNRVRMIVASFLVKDLHMEWLHGARWFEENLTDFDPASNSHGWQWTAGCGTDASPYYRVFNPVMQGIKFDPDGDYVRKFIPELRHLQGASAHEPWLQDNGYSHGYPMQIVDHAAERVESLSRLEELKNTKKD